MPEGAQLGLVEEDHYGRWNSGVPVFAGRQVGPPQGFASLAEARASISAMIPGPDTGDRPSAVALLREGNRFVGRFLVKQGGHDVRTWHVPSRFVQHDSRWVDTVDGPPMFPGMR